MKLKLQKESTESLIQNLNEKVNDYFEEIGLLKEKLINAGSI